MISTSVLKEILNTCKQHGITLFLDECFLPFVTDNSTQSLLPECAAYSNLFLLRAFTKQYAMAGLRLGFGVCSNKILLQQMFHCGQPWSVSIPAQHAGIAALQCNDYWAQSLTLIDTERAFLIQELKKAKYEHHTFQSQLYLVLQFNPTGTETQRIQYSHTKL